MNIFKGTTIIEYSLFWWSIFLITYFYTNNILIEIGLCLLGLFLHTIIEYGTHRYIFHGPLWNYHRIHHKFPRNENNLMVPFVYSVPTGLMCCLLYIFLCGIYYGMGILRGQIIGYIGFEYIHYIGHTTNKITNKFKEMKYIKYLIGGHKKHHIEYEKRYINYGFTTLYWDKLFGTIYIE